MNYTLQKLPSSSHYIMLDAKTVAKLTKGNNKRVICTINRTEKLHAAIMPKKAGGHFIIIGSSICKKLQLKVGDELHASFEIDKTEYQFAMPEELKEVLDTDEEANKIFDALTPGNQHGLIYLLSLVKSSDKKIERALKIAESIKMGITSQQLVLKK
jgi:Bacteriocin-protection, YdeI or OmpD-Associated/Domain of unknown function (DUF1905)